MLPSMGHVDADALSTFVVSLSPKANGFLFHVNDRAYSCVSITPDARTMQLDHYPEMGNLATAL